MDYAVGYGGVEDVWRFGLGASGRVDAFASASLGLGLSGKRIKSSGKKLFT